MAYRPGRLSFSPQRVTEIPEKRRHGLENQPQPMQAQCCPPVDLGAQRRNQSRRIRSADDQGGREVVAPGGGLATAFVADVQRNIATRIMSAILRSTVKFLTVGCYGTRLASSAGPTLSTQCNPFLIARWLQIAATSYVQEQLTAG